MLNQGGARSVRIGRDQLLALCERLDPRREPGRLTLIARMGAQKVGERLPPLVEAVRAAGHPVIWLSDPMHGNTIVAPCGNKTRLVRSIAEEVAAAFTTAVLSGSGVAAELHTWNHPDDVTRCVAIPTACTRSAGTTPASAIRG
ncbi:3-deoxy-7-phosphoheptulonate synthase [Pseudomonas aeruginosa]